MKENFNSSGTEVIGDNEELYNSLKKIFNKGKLKIDIIAVIPDENARNNILACSGSRTKRGVDLMHNAIIIVIFKDGTNHKWEIVNNKPTSFPGSLSLYIKPNELLVAGEACLLGKKTYFSFNAEDNIDSRSPVQRIVGVIDDEHAFTSFDFNRENCTIDYCVDAKAPFSIHYSNNKANPPMFNSIYLSNNTLFNIFKNCLSIERGEKLDET